MKFLDELLKYLPIYSLIILLTGLLQMFTFYYAFNIPILDYLSFEDCFLEFTKQLASYLIIMLGMTIYIFVGGILFLPLYVVWVLKRKGKGKPSKLGNSEMYLVIMSFTLIITCLAIYFGFYPPFLERRMDKIAFLILLFILLLEPYWKKGIDIFSEGWLSKIFNSFNQTPLTRAILVSLFYFIPITLISSSHYSTRLMNNLAIRNAEVNINLPDTSFVIPSYSKSYLIGKSSNYTFILEENNVNVYKNDEITKIVYK